MRKVFFVAAVALAVTFSGNVFANQLKVDSEEISFSLTHKQVDSKTAQLVLEYMSSELGYDLEVITGQYNSGTLTIDLVDGNYVVTTAQEDNISIAIEDLF